MRSLRALILAMGLPLAACGNSRSADWIGWAYPDRENLEHYVVLTGFETFESCHEATINVVRKFEQPETASYICGQTCHWDGLLGTNVCKLLKR